MSIGRSLYELAYVKSPIFLNDGIAAFIPGKTLPLIAITQAGDFTTGLLTGSVDLNAEDFFANFSTIPGATLHNNELGRYPFANQKIAANAIIAQPLNISMKMNCSPRLPGDKFKQQAIITALKNALDNHTYRGGTFSVLTPSFFYTGCILKSFKDITQGDSKNEQTDWQFDFEQPLLSGQEATLYQNALMSRLTNGLNTGVLWSGVPGL
jgi:hypothetical protein